MNQTPEQFPNIILEDERVLLRPLEENDYANLLPFALNEKGLWFYSLVRPEGEESREEDVEGNRKRAVRDVHDEELGKRTTGSVEGKRDD